MYKTYLYIGLISSTLPGGDNGRLYSDFFRRHMIRFSPVSLLCFDVVSKLDDKSMTIFLSPIFPKIDFDRLGNNDELWPSDPEEVKVKEGVVFKSNDGLGAKVLLVTFFIANNEEGLELDITGF